MIEHRDQLREAMVAHEHLAPEPAAVYARVQELAKTYRRRRLVAQTASGAVLGVAVIAGAFQIPHLVGGQNNGGSTVVLPAAPSTPSAAPSPVPAEPSVEPSYDDPEFTDAEEKARNKYFDEGYGLDDGEKLAKIWKTDITAAKTRAGQMLLDGKKLPIKPPVAPPGLPSTAQEAQAEAFFDKGYDFDDAERLARLWKLPTPWDAKVAAGKKIMAGETLPIQP
ncbi:hypothetical protein AB0M54_19730 [Actinoplanes sp. NPDC051470]|uniref:hypothetical protein n=1 Tax=Actinoplanes sp. NPDC051470 TaxID=3157224 RepID=UPI00343E6940